MKLYLKENCTTDDNVTLKCEKRNGNESYTAASEILNVVKFVDVDRQLTTETDTGISVEYTTEYVNQMLRTRTNVLSLAERYCAFTHQLAALFCVK